MDIVYFVLFVAVGLFNVVAAVLDLKWYIDYWLIRNPMKQPTKKRHRIWRIFLFAAGVLMIFFGVAVLAGWL